MSTSNPVSHVKCERFTLRRIRGEVRWCCIHCGRVKYDMRKHRKMVMQ